ncbi:MAG: hypothetical protein M1832_001137 [Thelocarpon impressellum]|nr:MAG: hypothetical protein M1832_001137 [Thelocarpon impressellum]
MAKRQQTAPDVIDRVKAAIDSESHAGPQTGNGFVAYSPGFLDILGSKPSLVRVLESERNIFHEAAVYVSGDVYVTGNAGDVVGASANVEVHRIVRAGEKGGAGGDGAAAQAVEVPKAVLPMANGGVNYEDGIIFCAQGSQDRPAGLVHITNLTSFEGRYLLDNFYGRPFNSPNDVVVGRDGSIWFTDPTYGNAQGFRPAPQLPNQVYRFEPWSGDVSVAADGFVRPNGISFSPDQKTVYITDTGQILGEERDATNPSTIYAFDVDTPVSGAAAAGPKRAGRPFLTNRRVFAYASQGVPDGVKCDTAGNVYSGCGDGVVVWDPRGTLLGKIAVKGGVANFCFGRAGEMFLLNEKGFWRAQLDGSKVKGALLGI